MELENPVNRKNPIRYCGTVRRAANGLTFRRDRDRPRGQHEKRDGYGGGAGNRETSSDRLLRHRSYKNIPAQQQPKQQQCNSNNSVQIIIIIIIISWRATRTHQRVLPLLGQSNRLLWRSPPNGRRYPRRRRRPYR